MDNATKIYQDILAAGEPGLQKMKLEREPETNFLDFKRASKNSAPLQQDDRTNLVKAVGGFANSDGGVLVWGVYATVVNGIDGVCELLPIKNLKQFKNELDNITPKNVYPLPDGILHTPIFPDPNLDQGYVVTLVPAWNGLPVRSTIKGLGSEFYHRAGDEFKAMSHSHLADRFGRRPQPKLRLAGKLASPYSGAIMEMTLAILNEGNGAAKSVSVIVEPPARFSTSTEWGHAYGVHIANSPFNYPGCCFEAPFDLVVHPGTSKVFYRTFGAQGIDLDQFAKDHPEIPYQLFCDGFTHAGVLRPNRLLGPNESVIAIEFV